MKDNFSIQSDKYLKYRPQYPKELIELVVSHCENNERAWDVGTGNGQMASLLANYFGEVQATDISENQLANAIQKANVNYFAQTAESTTFQDSSFDMAVVAQAMHWFDLDKFFSEVHRVLKPNGVFAAVGYSLPRIEGVDELLWDFYENKIGDYWDPERMIVQEKYQTIPFPFDDLGDFDFETKNFWAFEDFIGYLKTWSAVKHFELANDTNPVEEWKEKFRKDWSDDAEKEIITPVFLRLGRVM